MWRDVSAARAWTVARFFSAVVFSKFRRWERRAPARHQVGLIVAEVGFGAPRNRSDSGIEHGSRDAYSSLR